MLPHNPFFLTILGILLVGVVCTGIGLLMELIDQGCGGRRAAVQRRLAYAPSFTAFGFHAAMRR